MTALSSRKSPLVSPERRLDIDALSANFGGMPRKGPSSRALAREIRSLNRWRELDPYRAHGNLSPRFGMMPEHPLVSLRVHTHVVAWFKAEFPDYREEMALALLAYQRAAAGRR